MILSTPSMYYITPPMFIHNEPRRCVYEQVRVRIEPVGDFGFVGWPSQFLSVENLYLTDSEIGQLLGGN